MRRAIYNLSKIIMLDIDQNHRSLHDKYLEYNISYIYFYYALRGLYSETPLSFQGFLGPFLNPLNSFMRQSLLSNRL